MLFLNLIETRNERPDSNRTNRNQNEHTCKRNRRRITQSCSRTRIHPTNRTNAILVLHNLRRIFKQRGNSAVYLLATYGVFAVMGPALFGFGTGVASERERGWLELKRALPSPAYSYILAKLLTTLMFTTIALMPIYMIAGFGGNVELARGDWFALFAIHLSATIPFVLIGIALGFSLNAGGAIALSNIVFLSLAILGGLWFPVFLFPEFMQTLANFMPSFHLAELALSIVDTEKERAIGFHILTIFAMTLGFLALAIFAWLRQRSI